MLGPDPRWIRPKSDEDAQKRTEALKQSSRGRKRKSKSKKSDSSSPEEDKMKMESPDGTVPLAALQESVFKPDAGGPAMPKRRRSSDDYGVHKDVAKSIMTTTSASSSHFDDGILRRMTIRSASSGNSGGTEEVRRRLPKRTTFEARNINYILKRASLSSTNASASNLHLPLPPMAVDVPLSPQADENEKPFPDPWHALPGDFLHLHSYRQQALCFEGLPAHGPVCWCAVAEGLSGARDRWVLADGELGIEPIRLSNDERDQFGNTLFHLLAARENLAQLLLDQVAGAEIRDIAARNSAGQTFLHVLGDWWYSDLGERSNLFKLLRMVAARDGGIDLIFARDVYGRTFFHAARPWLGHAAAASLEGLLASFSQNLLAVRDAFGFKPLATTGRGHAGGSVDPNTAPPALLIPTRQPTSTLAGGLSPVNEDPDRVSYLEQDDASLLGLTPVALLTSQEAGLSKESGVSDPVEKLTRAQTDLVRLCYLAYEQPRIEDAEGRNGLHCLAIAIMDPERLEALRTARGVSRPRKRKQEAVNNAVATSTKKLPSSRRNDATETETADQPGDGGIWHPRLDKIELVAGMLKAGVDPGHYDLAGNSVLHAFVVGFTPPEKLDAKPEVLDAAEKEDAALLQEIAARIIDWHDNKAASAGNEGDGKQKKIRLLLEARNREGETPLMLAARLGRQAALRALLRLGANVHVRDIRGRGVLEVLDDEVHAVAARRQRGKGKSADPVTSDGGEGGAGDTTADHEEKERERNEDLKRYGRLEGCRALLTGTEAGVAPGVATAGVAVQKPGLLDEWSWRWGR